MMRPLPKTLQRLIAAHPDKIDEGWSEQDDFAYQGSWGHWLYLKPGWINPITETHMIHEPTVAEVLAGFRALQPCYCEECRKMMRKRKKTS